MLNAGGHEVMVDCRRGERGICAIDLVDVDGEIDHRDVFCACVSRARGTITVDTLLRADAI